MEQLNKVTLRGTVGKADVTEVDGFRHTRMSVATNLVYKGSDGYTIIDTTWHNVVYWGKKNIAKGDKIEVEGRIKNQRYTDSEGNERISSEIIAKSVKLLDNNEGWTFEQ